MKSKAKIARPVRTARTTARYSVIGGVRVKVAAPAAAAKRAPEIRKAVRAFYAARQV